MAETQRSWLDDPMEDDRSDVLFGEDPDIADFKLIEERIESGLQAFLNEYEPSFHIENPTPDLLHNRYNIHLDHPLPELDTGGGKAYAANDSQHPDAQLYAMVCDPKIPYRMAAIEGLHGAGSRNLLTCHDYGVARISEARANRLTMVFDRPVGTRMSDYFDKRQRFSEQDLYELVLRPIAGVLQILREKGGSHGRINPRDIFVEGNTVRLSECVSEPHGLTQDFLYEPIERLLTDPIAKGSATEQSDVYAMGVLAVESLYGLDKFRNLSRDEFTALLLDKGAYNLFVGERDISDLLLDFFRGVFVDNKAERWTLDSLNSWLNGRRFNLVLPSSPNDATRPFEMHGKEYFSIRALAHGLYRHWSASVAEISEAKLDRWLEMSAHKGDLAEEVRRVLRSFGTSYARSEAMSSEMLMRLIVTLDPMGPIRYRGISVNVDGIGMALAHYYFENNQRDIGYLREIIASDMPSIWADLSTIEKTQSTRDLLYRMQRNKVYAKQQQMGFGLERMLYDFNPTLPCHCEWLMPFHVMEIDNCLQVMDTLSKRLAPDTKLNDKHLGAFLASKTAISKEANFARLSKLPRLHGHPELQALRLIQISQDKKMRKKLPGLACWAAMRLEVLMENIHSRKLRKKMKLQLRAAAKTGLLGKVLAILVENEFTHQDYSGFRRASLVYHHNKLKMDSLANRAMLKDVSRDLGGRISSFVAYIILTITIITLIDIYL